jgi:iron(III) transport system permease protein
VAFYPLAMLASEAGFRRVDAALEEAGLMITNPLQVFLRITLPLVAPLVAASGLLVFALSVSEFGVPGLLRVRVFTTEVFTAFAALYDFGRATALAVPLLAVTMITAIIARWAIGERLLTANTSVRPICFSGRASGVMGLLFAFLVALVAVVLPIAVLAANAERVIENAVPAWKSIRSSILLSLTAASLIVILGVLLGYARGRTQSPVRTPVDLLLIATFAMPSTVVGVGIIGLWNREMVPIALYSSGMTIVLGYMARFLPVAILIIAAAVRHVSVSSEEAAELSGVGWWRAFSRILLPQIRGGVIAAWITVFVFTFGELGATILVSPPGESTLPVRVYTLIANAHQGEIATLALLQALATIVPLGLFGLTLGKFEGKL